MRLTADLAQHCAQRINPLRERELDLRGYKLGQIENLGVLRDQARAARPPPPTAASRARRRRREETAPSSPLESHDDDASRTPPSRAV